ncbi:MAG TPA: hypothetical protein VES88_06805 [Gemmatimonadaceae bacterium]|nr:hypothetical protein [Gemmatimonadaceae bacterium]
MPTSPGQSEHRQRLHPPFAKPDPGRGATPHMAAEAPADETDFADFLESSDALATEGFAFDSSESLPSIDRFVDDLPSIDEFLLEPDVPLAVHPNSAKAAGSVANQHLGETDSEGWAEGDWQSYDWSGLASLGAPVPEAAEAHAAWSTTNWDAGRHAPADTSTHLREDEVAAALVEIARRIRSGELSLHQFRGSPPEAAIVAAFASLLRNRG